MMARYLRLVRRDNGQADSFQDVDEEICALLGVQVDRVNWCRNWYNRVGLLLAVGQSFAEVREVVSADLHPVVDWLEANYTPDVSWGR